MITFKLSFLLAFPLQSRVSNDTKLKNKPRSSIDESSLPYFLGSTHINYELVPGKCKYDIDVICWGTISKIITKDGQLIMKTIIKDSKAWVPFSVDHNLGNFKLDEIKKFKEHVVKFNITANEMQSRYLTVPTYEIEPSNTFYEIVEDAVNRSIAEPRKDSLKNYLRILVMRCSNYTKSESVSWLHHPESYYRIYNIIDTECSGQVYNCRQFSPPAFDTQDNNDKKSKTKEQTKNVQKVVKRQLNLNDINIYVPAEVFFTDPNFSIYRQESSTGTVSNAFIIFAVDSLMTKAQKLILNPLIIKIKKLVNVPVDILQQYGVESVYFSYDIPFIAALQSAAKPLTEQIYFTENRIYFTDQVPKLKLIESLQSKRFYVEIYGIRNEPPVVERYSLFGEEPDDYAISRILSYMEQPPQKLPNPILFAVAAYDVSTLLENVWDFRELGQCHTPNLTFFQNPYKEYNICFSDVKTANEVNFSSPSYVPYPVIVPEAVYLALGTCLDVETYLTAPQATSLILHQIPNTFKRLFVIFYEEELANGFYTELIDHHEAERNALKNDPKPQNLEFEDIITGFVLDNGNNFAFFTEGPSSGFILNAWHIVDQYSFAQAKVFFNTEYAFEKRLYSHFLDEGLLSITLKMPLNAILVKYKLYLKKNVPVPCLEALKKLSVLFHSSNMKSILQQNLFPLPKELISLDLEWGIPLRWKKQPISTKLSMLL